MVDRREDGESGHFGETQRRDQEGVLGGVWTVAVTAVPFFSFFCSPLFTLADAAAAVVALSSDALLPVRLLLLFYLLFSLFF